MDKKELIESFINGNRQYCAKEFIEEYTTAYQGETIIEAYIESQDSENFDFVDFVKLMYGL